MSESTSIEPRACGVYSTAHLLGWGVDHSRLRRLVDDGQLIRLRQGWYAETAADPAVVAAVRGGGVLSCLSALRMYKIWVPPTDAVHIRRSTHRRPRLGVSCHGFGAQPRLSDPVDSVLVAFGGAARCLAGGARRDCELLVAIADSILNGTVLTSADLRGAVAAAPPRIRRLLDLCDGTAQAGTESLTRIRLRSLNIVVRTQVVIPGVGRVDLLVGERLIIECDSRAHHTAATNYQEDRRRDRAALAAGYLVLRVTYADVMYRWEEVLADILKLIRRHDHRSTKHAR
ncbi:DUF559 domain-containing protein [Jongsikchunia kroppenstedtii]|uniref:DUF559 domain-containing protein n=1 Tax=Jongsikchunia kroppenstedtii TaxID=1121721 RepID=UPI000363B66A|nr:DUF559 domain-containing protein [Jongsikchunia kroppenstedtii]